MMNMGLYQKFPAEEAMLTDFKGYLINTLQVTNCQQVVRYIPFLFLFSLFRIALGCLCVAGWCVAFLLTASSPISLFPSQIDNVSRMLRYIQPSGDKVTLDFLLKSTETKDFLTQLRHADMGPATILNYIKNMIRFVQYLKTHLNLVAADPDFYRKCQAYIDLLTFLRKPVSKSNSKVTCKIRSVANLPSILFSFMTSFMLIVLMCWLYIWGYVLQTCV